jgi:hypothetical protein
LAAAVAVAVRKNHNVLFYTQISTDARTTRFDATDRGGQLLLGHASVHRSNYIVIIV